MAKVKEAFLKKHLEEQIPKSDYNVRTGAKRSAKKSFSDRRLTEEERSVFQEGGPAVKKLLERMIEEREQRKLEIEKIVKEIQQKEEEIKRLIIREKKKNSYWPSQPSWTNGITKRKTKVCSIVTFTY